MRLGLKMGLRQRGFTIIEVAISTALIAVMLPVMGLFMASTVEQAPRVANRLVNVGDLDGVRTWLLQDARAAESFTPLSEPDYGSFQWTDYTGAQPRQMKVTYSYDSEKLLRKLEVDGATDSILAIARSVASYGDVSFQWFPNEGYVKADITTTGDAAGVGDPLSDTHTVVAYLRGWDAAYNSQPDTIECTPPPPAGYICYFIPLGLEPEIVVGDYDGGEIPQLWYPDSDFYSIDAEMPDWPNKRVEFIVKSDIVEEPDPVGGIRIRYTGKATSAGQSGQNQVQLEFYVDYGTGFPPVPDSTYTFTQANVIETHEFDLDQEAIDYFNTLPLEDRQLRLTIVGTNTANFTLKTDQIVFMITE